MDSVFSHNFFFLPICWCKATVILIRSSGSAPSSGRNGELQPVWESAPQAAAVISNNKIGLKLNDVLLVSSLLKGSAFIVQGYMPVFALKRFSAQIVGNIQTFN